MKHSLSKACPRQMVLQNANAEYQYSQLGFFLFVLCENSNDIRDVWKNKIETLL